MKCEEQNKLMRHIQHLEFAVVDLNLFLDTHPRCQQALMDYNMLTQQLMKAKRTYEMNYGPLTNFGNAPSGYPWQWNDTPWPWEPEAN